MDQVTSYVPLVRTKPAQEAQVAEAFEKGFILTYKVQKDDKGKVVDFNFNHPCLAGTVFDQGEDGSILCREVKIGGQILVVETVKPRPEIAHVLLDNGSISEVWGFRCPQAWPAKVNSLLREAAVTKSNLQTTCYAPQLIRALSSSGQKPLESFIKGSHDTPGIMWAWSNMSALPDNVVGMTEPVVEKLFFASLGWGKRNASTPEQISLVKMAGITWKRNISTHGAVMTGSQILLQRHPATAANAADPVTLQVVRSDEPMMGVNARTAKSRLGDFDHDLAFALYGIYNTTVWEMLAHVAFGGEITRNIFPYRKVVFGDV